MSSPDIGFSLTTGGPFHRLLVALGCERRSPWLILTVGGLFGAAAWLPLFGASMVDGLAFGWPGAFVQDTGVHTRLLLALPLLLWAERPLTRRIDGAMSHLVEAGLIDDANRSAVLATIRRAERLRDLPGLDLAVAIAAMGLSSVDLVERSHGLRTWVYPAADHVSTAGLVYLGFGAPLFRFVALRWLVRFLVWGALVVGLARSQLKIDAAHPDRCGGLSVLYAAHTSFGWLILAAGISLAGNLTTEKQLLHRSVTAYQHETLAFAVVAPLVFLLPLFAFSWPLEKARRRFHEGYASAAADFAGRYARRWIFTESREPLPLGTSETSAHTDLVTSYEHVEQTQLLPFSKRVYLTLFITAAAPMCLFALQEVPLLELLSRVRQLTG